MISPLIFSLSKIPKRTALISSLTVKFKELSTTFKSSQKVHTLVQWKKEMFYGLLLLFTKILSGRINLFVYKILLNILYCNSLNLVSNVVMKGSRYIFSQSNWGKKEWFKPGSSIPWLKMIILVTAEPWEGLLFATDALTTCVEAIFRVKWFQSPRWSFSIKVS